MGTRLRLLGGILDAACCVSGRVPSHSTLKSKAGPLWRRRLVPSHKPVEPPQYVVSPCEVMPSGWIPPRGTTQPLPFTVARTPLGKQLPVYSAYAHGRTCAYTLLRTNRIGGDTRALAVELSRVLDGVPVLIKNGCLEMKGNHVGRVRTWLAGLGF